MKRKVSALILSFVLIVFMFAGCYAEIELTSPYTPPEERPQPQEDTDIPAVYFTTDISPEGLMAVYEALGITPTGNIAIKVTTGEPPNSNYLRSELIGDFARFLDGTIVECNTA